MPAAANSAAIARVIVTIAAFAEQYIETYVAVGERTGADDVHDRRVLALRGDAEARTGRGRAARAGSPSTTCPRPRA